MSEKNSAAVKRYWKKVPKKVRTEIMRVRALSRWALKTPEERREHAMKMVKARKLKVRSESKENVIKINK